MRRSKTASPSPESRGNFTPPRGSAAEAESPGAQEEGSGSRFALRNWRVATRLNAILLIPVLVALIFGGLTVRNSVQTLNAAEDAEKTAELVHAATAYGHALLDERDRTVAPLLKGEEDAAEVVESRKATDEAADTFHAAADRAPKTASLQHRLDGVAEAEPKLDKLRQGAYTKALAGVKTQLGYVEVQHPLMNLANELSLDSGNITSYGRTVYAVSLAKAAESLTRSIGTHLLVKPGPGEEAKKEQVTAFGSYAYLENIALTEAFAAGTEEDNARLRADLEGLQKKAEEEAAKAEEADEDFVAPPDMQAMTDLIATGASPSALAKDGVTSEVWYKAATAKFDVYRTVERDLADRAVSEAGDIAADAKREAIINAAIVLAALLIAFLLAGFMARAMSRNMNRLRNAAFDVAEQRLPSLVQQLSRTDPGKVDTEVRRIPIDSRDEIGEVARAFDQVHREAVRLAAEQALLRGNVNAIFTNLSSRNQGLIERQLGLITDLENNEADPDQLENLFKLDHLATRMRRNGENLLVLAGEDSVRRWNQPVPLVDVMRAASSEVEAYERIEITGVPESDIHGQVVTDLVHLLAELLENATSFSSPQTKVKVTATRLPDGRVMIEIHDKGIGLTAKDFADINHKLADPPKVDAAISQRMGLYVVGRLADRHSIRVQLRPSGEQAGTTSLVMLPEAITHGGGGQGYVEENFSVSRIVPEQAAPAGSPEQIAGPHDPGGRVPGGASSLEAGGPFGSGGRAALGPGSGDLFGADGHGGESPDSGGYVDGLEDDPDHYDAFAPPQRRGSPPAGSDGHGPGETFAGFGQQGAFGGGETYDAGPQGDPYAPEQPYPGGYAQGEQGDGHAPGGSYGQEQAYAPDQGYPQGQGYDERQQHGGGLPPQPFGDEQQHGAASGELGGSQGPRQGPGTDQGQGGGQAPEERQYGADPLTSRGLHTRVPGRTLGQGPGGPVAGESFDAFGQGSPAFRAGSGLLGGSTRQGEDPNAPWSAGSWAAQGVPEGGVQSGGAGAADGSAGEPGPGAPAGGQERVGFDRPGSSSDTSPSLTSAGLPRRERSEESLEESEAPQVQPESAPEPPRESGSDEGEWRSTNDERWERAESVRHPKAGGVTISGLPRRVPRANLVEGTAEQTLQGGPQVSRSPEDVRGRLSNLHRGVRQGRAGSQGASQTDQPGSSAGSTYDQER
ncbi:nitrate- and nitrite sensing domain-containing protein [Streptomyces sp. XM4193]|uniref:nitrate- and nitrite sensing domain-containing protein n=1 Tax=Streptomyces sp. XM4193 TaxID=2929782 RepID=UPI001FFB6DB5|nr:nitrate- and nitrite sensing domain-containing protein [Streptomyces sp. XM4193]MCK1798786.1 nitrate- and nitrite sensing domain-containing protein [Streptomyces sp. XM4193]